DRVMLSAGPRIERVEACAAAADERAAASDREERVVIDRDVRREAEAIAVAPHDLAGEHVEGGERRLAAREDGELARAARAEERPAPRRVTPADLAGVEIHRSEAPLALADEEHARETRRAHDGAGGARPRAGGELRRPHDVALLELVNAEHAVGLEAREAGR